MPKKSPLTEAKGFTPKRKIPELKTRQQRDSSFATEFRALEEGNREIEFPVSSEAECIRWYGTEILSHKAGSIDLTRFSDSAPLLWNHCPEEYIGVIKRTWVEGNRLWVRVYFDTHPLADQIFQSVSSGVLRNVSVGYQISSYEETRDSEGNYTITATSWMPLEASIVSIPADASVGIGRSMEIPEEEILEEDADEEDEEETILIEIKEEKTMDKELEKVRSEERDRINAIGALCDKFNQSSDLRNKLIAEGIGIDAARAMVLDNLSSAPANVTVPVASLGLTDREQRQYSLRKALLAFASDDWSDAGFEREISLEIAKKANKPTRGFLIPVRDLKIAGFQQRATMATSSPSTGGVFVDTVLDSANMIEYLRARTLVVRLGARLLSGLEGDLDIPRQSGSANIYWVGEDEAVTQSEPTTDKVTLTPKTLGVKSKYTRKTLQQSSVDVEQFLREDLANAIAQGIDIAAINGTGSSNQPRGILNYSIPTVSLGTNGGAPTWTSIVAMETSIANANADIGQLSYLTNSKVRGVLKTTLKNPTASNSDWIWSDMATADPTMGMLNGYRAGVSNNVPNTLTKGSGSNLSSIIFGNFSDVLLGEWGILEILPNPYGSGYDSGSVEIRALQTIDIQMRRLTSFSKIIDAVAA